MEENIFDLYWGNVTPEGFDSKNKEVIHVINHDITSNEKIEMNIRFIVGRVLWFKRHIPKELTQRIVIDTRGQDIIYSRLKKMKNEILNKVKFVDIEFLM